MRRPVERRPSEPYRGRVNRRLLARTALAVLWLLMAARPVSAHGDHDARPLARNLAAGPFTISLWQVYPDASTAMIPHLIVLFDGLAAAPPGAVVHVAVNGRSMAVLPSTTTANGFETTEGVDEGNVVAVTIADGARSWALDPVVVPPPPTSMLPMQELIYGSMFLTIATIWWAAGRFARAWRRPAVRTS